MINKEMTIQQILMTDSGVADILMDAGMHCLGCAMASGEIWSRPVRCTASTLTAWLTRSTIIWRQNKKARG